MHILASHLGQGILYQKIRVEGGAYGGYSMYNSAAGQFLLLSYRDPNLERTLSVYDGVIDDFLKELLDESTVRKAIINTISILDRPLDAADRGYAALERMLVGLTDADRQRFREGILSTDGRALHAAAHEVLQPAMRKATQSVYAPRARIEAANAELAEKFELIGLE